LKSRPDDHLARIYGAPALINPGQLTRQGLAPAPEQAKVFWFFFSKKNDFLPL
jgi:hypothetical protein